MEGASGPDRLGSVWGDRLGRWSTRSLQVLLLVQLKLVVSTVAGLVTGVLLMIVVLFYFLKDGDRIWEFLLTAGTIVAGIIGAVLAVPIAAVVWAIIRVWDGPDASLDERPPRKRRRAKRADAASHDELPPAAAGCRRWSTGRLGLLRGDRGACDARSSHLMQMA
jgi:hypothetical protein